MVSIFAKTCICPGNTQVHLQFFCKSKLWSTQKGQAATQMDHSVFRFMGCRVKANTLVIGNSVVVIITVNSISFYETAICREIFSTYFFISIFMNCQKIIAVANTPVAKSYVSKVADFYRSNHWMHSVKKVLLGVRKIHRKRPVSETLILIKLRS